MIKLHKLSFLFTLSSIIVILGLACSLLVLIMHFINKNSSKDKIIKEKYNRDIARYRDYSIFIILIGLIFMIITYFLN